MSIETSDRYAAMGIPHPDPETMCLGLCEGTGWVPINADKPNDDVGPWHDLWLMADESGPADELGYHFVLCPTCNGTGLRDSQ